MHSYDPNRRGGVVAFFVRHPNAANLLMILLIIGGLFSLNRMNSQFFPTFSTDAIEISVVWSGASAEDIEANILQIIEPKVRFLDGLKEVQSIAREGAAAIILDYKPEADMQLALRDVEAAVDSLSNLPDMAEKPEVSYRLFRDNVSRLILSGPFEESALREFAKVMRDDLLERGIDAVSFGGLRDEEFFVGVTSYDLRRLGLTIKDMASQVAFNSRDLPSGKVNDGIEKQIRTLAVEETPERLMGIEIKSGNDGSSVELGDIARIERRLDPDQVRGVSGGGAAIELVVKRAPSADSLEAAAIVDDYLKEARASFPKTLSIVQYDAAAEALVDRILLLVKNAASGLVLVVIILALFLSIRTALWVTAGIPVAMLAACVVLLAMGQSINMISLFGFIMMLGIIVDDAIVVGEETTTRFEAGQPGPVAAEGGGSRMLAPVFAASMTTIAAFAPILLIGNTIGQIMGVLPIVVIAVLIASLIECFFILPGHLAHSMTPHHRQGWNIKRVITIGVLTTIPLMLFHSLSPDLAAKLGGSFETSWQALQVLTTKVPALVLFVAFGFLLANGIEAIIQLKGRNHNPRANHGRPKQSAFRQKFDRGFANLRDGPFRKMVTLSYVWRYTTLALCVAAMILAIGFIRGGRVGFVFFPSPESETVNLSLVFNVGILEEDAVKIITKIDKVISDAEKELGKGEKLIVGTFATLGSSGRTTADNVAGMRLRLTSSEVRTVRTKTFSAYLRRNMPDIPGLKTISVRGQRGGPPGSDLDVRMTGADPETLKMAALDLRERLSSYPGVSELADNMPYGKPELVLEVLPRGASLGFTAQSVGDQVRDQLEGRTARKLAILDDEVDVVIQKLAEPNVDSLRSIWLKSPAGSYVPLTEIVSLRDRQGFSRIQRYDGKTTVSVTGDINSSITTVSELIPELDAGLMPEISAKYGVDYHFSGRDEEQREAFADLRTGVMIALAFIYIILAWVFASYARPLAIMLIIPFGLVGAVLGHYILGFQLTILSMIGLLGLSGILVNDSIILVSRLDERLAHGEDLQSASIGASCDRFRAVLLTSLTTVSGLTPLLFETSMQAQFLKPMAITIVFGLAVATLFVLFLVPSLFGVGSDIKRLIIAALEGKWRRERITPAE